MKDDRDNKQCEFSDALTDGVIDWLDQYKVDSGVMPRSDWIIVALMVFAGTILKRAPNDEMKRRVLKQALESFGLAAGGKLMHFDVERAEQDVVH